MTLVHRFLHLVHNVFSQGVSGLIIYALYKTCFSSGHEMGDREFSSTDGDHPRGNPGGGGWFSGGGGGGGGGSPYGGGYRGGGGERSAGIGFFKFNFVDIRRQRRLLQRYLHVFARRARKKINVNYLPQVGKENRTFDTVLCNISSFKSLYCFQVTTMTPTATVAPGAEAVSEEEEEEEEASGRVWLPAG